MNRILVAVLAVLIVALVAVVVVIFEPVEEDLEPVPSGEAATNMFYAAERLLAEMGLPTRSVWSITETPDTDTLLVVLDDNPTSREMLTESVLDWVARGGRLLIGAPSDEQDAPIFNGLGVSRLPMFDGPSPSDTGWNPEAEDPEAEDEDAEQEVVAASLVLSRLPFSDAPDLTMSITPNWALMHSATRTRWSVTTSDGVLRDVAIVVPYGDGEVALIGDTVQWTNEFVGDAENATLLWEMVQAIQGDTAKALLVVRGGAPSLWSLLWMGARPALISLAALVLASMWRSSRRFGPLFPEAPRNRRSVIEHIDAVGGYLWRQPDEAGRTRLVHGARAAAQRTEEDVRAPLPENKRAFLEEIRQLQPDWRRK